MRTQMAEILMCLNRSCPSSGECYRHQAVPEENWQPFKFLLPDDSGRCGEFLPLAGGQAHGESDRRAPSNS
jgi:hypothetical protein